MNSRSAIAGVSVLTTVTLGLLTEGIASNPALDAWFQSHFPLVLAVTGALILIAIFAEASNTLERSVENGVKLTSRAMAGTLATEALRWAVTGAVVGLVASQWLWPWAQRVAPPVFSSFWMFLVDAGPIAVTCVGLGLIAGADLRNADMSHSASLELTGSVAGGFVGFVGASYFELATAPVLPNGWTVGVPIIAGATVAGLIGTLTAVFKPRADAERERELQLERANLALFERSVMRLRRLGYEVRYVEQQEFTIRRTMLDMMLEMYLEKADAGMRARVKRAVYQCSFDDFIQKVQPDFLKPKSQNNVKRRNRSFQTKSTQVRTTRQ